MQRSRLAATLVAAATVAGAAAVVAATAHAQAGASTGLDNNWYAAAPYLMPQSNNPPDPVTVMNATGQKAFQLAFILAPKGGGCSPTWDGTSPVSSDTTVGDAINRIRGNGGDVSVSVGGYGGTKLGQTCGTVDATAAAYQQVVTKYNLKAIDFDLEEPEYEDTAAIANELGAAKKLQADNPGLFVSVTMPGTAAGTGWFGTQLLDKAKSIGFSPNNFSIMPFDGGFNGGGASQVSALEAFHGLLQSHLGWDSETAYSHEGFSGMNGKSDTSEYFNVSDFQTVYDYATSHHLGRFTFWAVNRDRQCTTTTDNSVCSNVQQNDWDFTKFTTRFAGATPPQTTPPTSPTSPTSNPPGTCSAPDWQKTQVYTGGNVVSHNGHKWTAKWWTQGEEPGTTGQWGVWTDNGGC
ncbi:chitinase [Amycolatopsis silviterrae]|uniref:Chitinase n=1 Tax=Amycolatopsis silviterrae TaxID=1656914 RepID=A0ABW5H9C2_9PSEU